MKKQCFIIRRDGEYLESIAEYGKHKVPTWSIYKYDAVRIHDFGAAREIAGRVARLTGQRGIWEIMHFNSLNGSEREVISICL